MNRVAGQAWLDARADKRHGRAVAGRQAYSGACFGRQENVFAIAV